MLLMRYPIRLKKSCAQLIFRSVIPNTLSFKVMLIMTFASKTDCDTSFKASVVARASVDLNVIVLPCVHSTFGHDLLSMALIGFDCLMHSVTFSTPGSHLR